MIKPGQAPLAFDLLRQIETPVAARLDPRRFWGLDVSNPLELTIEEIGQTLGPLMEYSHPDQHSERVQFYDVTSRRVLSINPGQTVTVELVRQALPVDSVAVIQRIGTWLRLSSTAAGGGAGLWELYDGVPGLGATPVGTPFPFPFAPPNMGTFDVEFILIRERIADAGRAPQPAFLTVGFPTDIPFDTPILSPWRDMRYMWNATFAESLYFVTGDRSMLRLFATMTVTGQNRWTVEIAGRLGGHFQVTGYRKAALDHALYRH